MRLADCFIAAPQGLIASLFSLGAQLIELHKAQSRGNVPDGFVAPQASLSPLERAGVPAYFHLDVAVTPSGPRLIEFQAVPTYQVTAARLATIITDELGCGTRICWGDGVGDWRDFKTVMAESLLGARGGTCVLIDRRIREQKTNFEFYATQTEICPRMAIVDVEQLREVDGCLAYAVAGARPVVVHQLYNRVLPLEAISDDRYPEAGFGCTFRYDKAYKNLEYCNHPSLEVTFSKRMLPDVKHAYNPRCYHLKEVSRAFETGALLYRDFVWKHTLGVAGREIFLHPSADILRDIREHASEEMYIAQKRVPFQRFDTGDGLEKIVELRLMFVCTPTRMLATPMARIGHIRRLADGSEEPRIHFGHNNAPGYGFAATVIVP